MHRCRTLCFGKVCCTFFSHCNNSLTSQARYEKAYLLFSFWTLCPSILVLVIYGMWRIQPLIVAGLYAGMFSRTMPQTWALLFSVAGFSTICARIVTVILSIRLYLVFGQGLKSMHSQHQHLNDATDDDFYNSSEGFYQSETEENDIESVIRRTYNSF